MTKAEKGLGKKSWQTGLSGVDEHDALVVILMPELLGRSPIAAILILLPRNIPSRPLSLFIVL